MDFYTIITSIKIEDNQEALQILKSRVGFFCQPDIMGDPYKEGSKYHLRFAVRKGGLLDVEEEFLTGLGGKFTTKNTKLVKAERL